MRILLLVTLVMAFTLIPMQSHAHAEDLPEPEQGFAVYSSIGIPELVLRNRLTFMKQDLRCDDNACVGYVAYKDCRFLGHKVWIRPAKQALFDGPFQIYDCVAGGDKAAYLAKRRIVDVDRPTSKRWGMRGPIAVEVTFQQPAQVSDLPPTSIKVPGAAKVKSPTQLATAVARPTPTMKFPDRKVPATASWSHWTYYQRRLVQLR